jgi:hypothetical protein
MSRNNIVFQSDRAQVITFSTKDGDLISYVYGYSDWLSFPQAAIPHVSMEHVSRP